MRLTRLEEIVMIKPFDCGDADLNGFLCEDASYYHQQLLANTFILEDEQETLAYFSLLNDKISQTTIAKNLWRKIRKNVPHEKHMGSYPAVKIGRLAVSLKCKGQGLGTDLVSAIKQMLVNRNTSISACRFLTVDAYKDALPFYLKNGFRMLVNDIENEQYTVPMYFDLKSLVVDTDLERTQVEQADDFTIAGRVFDDTF